MKKLILGLLLTVGISGVSFAGENIKEMKDKDTSDKNIEIIDCTSVMATNIKGICGTNYGTIKVIREETGDVICSGNEGGIVFFVDTFWINDCN